jgi:hypothetical protein
VVGLVGRVRAERVERPGLDLLGEGGRVEHRDVARAVVEQGCLAVVVDDVAGGVGVDEHVGELRLRRVRVRVVAVRLRVRAEVEHRPSARRRDVDVPAVTGGVDAVEALDRQVGDDLEARRVDHHDAAIVGEGEARLRARGLGRRVVVAVLVVIVVGVLVVRGGGCGRRGLRGRAAGECEGRERGRRGERGALRKECCHRGGSFLGHVSGGSAAGAASHSLFTSDNRYQIKKRLCPRPRDPT